MGKCVWKKLIPQEREKTPVKWKGKVKKNVKSKLSHFSTFLVENLPVKAVDFTKNRKKIQRQQAIGISQNVEKGVLQMVIDPGCF